VDKDELSYYDEEDDSEDLLRKAANASKEQEYGHATPQKSPSPKK
jgi:hypothetical protein